MDLAQFEALDFEKLSTEELNYYLKLFEDLQSKLQQIWADVRITIHRKNLENTK